MNPHLQARVQLRVGTAGIGLPDQTLHGCLERSIAGEARKDGQTPEDAHARGGQQRSREGGQVGDGLALEQAGESMAGWFWSEHRRLLGGLIQLGLQAPPKS